MRKKEKDLCNAIIAIMQLVHANMRKKEKEES